MNLKKVSFGKIIGITLISIIALILIAVTVMVILAFQDPYKDKYTTTKEADSTLIADLVEAAALGNDFVADDDDINAYIREYIERLDDSFPIKDIAIYFNSDEKIDIYGRFKMMNMDFAFYIKAEGKLDTEREILTLSFSDAKLGRLPLPNFIVSKILYKYLGEYFSVDGMDVDLPVSADYEIEGVKVPLRLEKFIPNDGCVTLCSNNILSDTIDNTIDRIEEWAEDNKDELEEWLRDLF